MKKKIFYMITKEQYYIDEDIRNRLITKILDLECKLNNRFNSNEISNKLRQNFQNRKNSEVLQDLVKYAEQIIKYIFDEEFQSQDTDKINDFRGFLDRLVKKFSDPKEARGKDYRSIHGQLVHLQSSRNLISHGIVVEPTIDEYTELLRAFLSLLEFFSEHYTKHRWILEFPLDNPVVKINENFKIKNVNYHLNIPLSVKNLKIKFSDAYNKKDYKALLDCFDPNYTGKLYDKINRKDLISLIKGYHKYAEVKIELVFRETPVLDKYSVLWWSSGFELLYEKSTKDNINVPDNIKIQLSDINKETARIFRIIYSESEFNKLLT